MNYRMPDRWIYKLFEVQVLYAPLTDSLTIFKAVTIKILSTPSINTAKSTTLFLIKYSIKHK